MKRPVGKERIGVMIVLLLAVAIAVGGWLAGRAGQAPLPVSEEQILFSGDSAGGEVQIGEETDGKGLKGGKGSKGSKSGKGKKGEKSKKGSKGKKRKRSSSGKGARGSSPKPARDFLADTIPTAKR